MRAFAIHATDESSALQQDRQIHGFLRMGLGAALLAVAVLGLRQDLRWIAQPFYAWVWWGYIFILDGFCVWKRGDSLLTTRIRFLFPICVWSITFWMFFELINSHIQNWYYVGVYPAGQLLAGALFTVLAFSTVFMGIFQTYDALAAAGLWKSWKGRKKHFRRGLSYLLQGIGVTMAVLALVFPLYLAPLVWGSFTLIVDPWNYRRGTRSLLRDLENGDYGLLCRLLLAGLICGVVWESLNFFAPQKWIYTVRGLENFKLFEMPLLGFLGFPALALDSTAGFALFASLFLGNRSWERPGDLSYELVIKRPPAPRVFWRSVVVHMLFWAAVAKYGTPINVASIQVELDHLGLTPAEQQQLADLNITRPRQFLRFSGSAEQAGVLSRELGWSEERTTRMRDRAALYTFKGIGHHHGQLLERAGVRRPEDLRRWDARELHRRIVEVAQGSAGEELLRAPRLDFVVVWVLAARDGGTRVVLNGGS